MVARLYDAYRVRNLRSASPATLRLWQIALRMFDRYLCRPATPDDLCDETLSGFASWRLESASPATTNRDLASLLALWRWAHRRNLIDRWPDVQLEIEPQRTPLAWSQDDFTKLLTAARSWPGHVGKIPRRLWWPALLLTCYDTAERIGAVLSLPWSAVDLHGRWVVFAAETRKGRRQDNAVRIASDTAAALAAMRRQDGVVFVWPYTYQYLWQLYAVLLRRAGLPADRRHKFHCIRRTTASHYEAAGGNATELLGHASRRNTLAYLDPRITRKHHAVDVLWRPTKNP